jgi:hypothetical protein
MRDLLRVAVVDIPVRVRARRAVPTVARGGFLNRAEVEYSVEQQKQYGNCQRREYCQVRSIEDEHGRSPSCGRDRAVSLAARRLAPALAKRFHLNLIFPRDRLDYLPRSFTARLARSQT